MASAYLFKLSRFSFPQQLRDSLETGSVLYFKPDDDTSEYPQDNSAGCYQTMLKAL